MKTRIRSFIPLLLAAVLTAPVAQAGHHGHDREQDMRRDIVATAAEAGQFETLIAAAKAAGLVGALTGEGPLTVFAPTDDAFGALPAGTVQRLLQPGNRSELARILKFHVIAGRVGSESLADGASLETLAGPAAKIAATESGFSIEGARIVATDIDASNGVVHVIDRVILPPETVSRSAAAGVIRMAIDHGVPLFNRGNHDATLGMYTVAARSLLDLAELAPEERTRLDRGLSEAEHAGSAGRASWQLRYALDDVLASLDHDGTGATTEPMAMSR